MTEIAETNDVVTLINVFTVAPGDQDRLVELLVTATEEVKRDQPGFVSANIHASFDGARVVNYAQWESRGDFEAIFEKTDVEEHMTEIRAIADADYDLYDVREVESA